MFGTRGRPGETPEFSEPETGTGQLIELPGVRPGEYDGYDSGEPLTQGSTDDGGDAERAAGRPDPGPPPKAAKAFASLASDAFKAAGEVVHDRVAVEGSDAWLVEDDEAERVGVPVGNIIARHVPVPGGRANDLADAFAAIVGLAGYLARQLLARKVAKAGPVPQGDSGADVSGLPALPAGRLRAEGHHEFRGCAGLRRRDLRRRDGVHPVADRLPQPQRVDLLG